MLLKFHEIPLNHKFYSNVVSKVPWNSSGSFIDFFIDQNKIQWAQCALKRNLLIFWYIVDNTGTNIDDIANNISKMSKYCRCSILLRRYHFYYRSKCLTIDELRSYLWTKQQYCCWYPRNLLMNMHALTLDHRISIKYLIFSQWHTWQHGILIMADFKYISADRHNVTQIWPIGP